MPENQNDNIENLIKNYSSSFIPSKRETAIILAAGHGKRIKSQTSKMLHRIWEIPTVERVYNSCLRGLGDANTIVVVGIKADEVVKSLGSKKSLSYAYQQTQNGTGHALQIALKNITDFEYDGTIYVFPGDMGLIDANTIKSFRESFEKSTSDMMVLTGIYEGEVGDNQYGRIIRVKESNSKKTTPAGNVIEILEYKDILGLDEKGFHKVRYGSTEYKFTRQELIENREFNSGVYAFKFKPLAELINKIGSNNAQNELYLTDLIDIFNKNGYKVEAVSPKEQFVLMGFNNKSVLKEMDAIARKLVYDKIKDIVQFEDPDDFFIEEHIVQEIIVMDNLGLPLDIFIGKGVHLGRGVKLNYNLKLMKNVFVEGDIHFGKNVCVQENARISSFYGQSIVIGDNVEICGGDIIKGNVRIGDNARIESGVKLTGSDQYHCIIGSHVLIKGLTYIFGSIVENQISIEHSVLIRKKISKPAGIKADIYSVKFYIPEVEGKDAVLDL